ncbi:uncharacterized protein ASCRUDRAFT_32381 [Ascoidea rubescens DSM 1968]|uniref:Amino acid permease/ SLC12A domain-containing protein n=1 Tax=Ascoidea rubescens DSM 1968 TaxID=1344418 RepID=A0A1D2VM94_9ASCO|nr:hypothetical protein ASCRUDRAFT_32381 [Ascoidea rubescens DSM 1968]ODV62675.1 hypothetical protein ASCRUDRAFT_32381 [Ascoidea rubescens DSM 1968]
MTTLKAYQILFIIYGGMVGTGLIVSSGNYLQKSGPLSLLLAYILTAIIVYSVCAAISEMAAYLPLPFFGSYPSRYVDPALGFATGYSFLFRFLIGCPRQITACALVFQYWLPPEKVNPGVWVLIFFISVALINYFNIKNFSLIEIYLSLFKIITLLGLIFLLIIIMLGGGPENDGVIGFRYWKDPGPFASYSVDIDGATGAFASWILSLAGSIYSYMSIENFCIIASEIVNPRKTIPKSFKMIFWSVTFLYLSLILLLGMCVPYNDPLLIEAVSSSASTATASPFVVAIKNAGIKVLDHVINACIIIFAFSSANTNVYFGTRTLYGLSISGIAHKIFSKTTKHGVPIYALLLVVLFNLISFMNISNKAKEYFQYFVDLSSMFALLCWISFLIAHIRFIKAFKAQGLDRKTDLKYRAPFAPYSSWFALITCLILALVKNMNIFLNIPNQGFDYQSFISSYISIPIYIICYFSYKLYYKTKIIAPADVDLFSYKDYVDADEEAFFREKNERDQHLIPGTWKYRWRKFMELIE